MDVAKALVKWLVWLLNQHQNLTSLKIVAYFRLLIFHNVCTDRDVPGPDGRGRPPDGTLKCLSQLGAVLDKTFGIQ